MTKKRAKKSSASELPLTDGFVEQPHAPWDSEQMPRFAGVPRFLRLPSHDLSSGVPEVDVLLCGVPFDVGTSFRPGARLGPRAIREASALARRFNPALGIDIYSELAVADGGDLPLSPHEVDLAMGMVTQCAEALARSGVVGGYVGGDQTLTLAALRGIHRAKLKQVGLVHFDSHSNTAPAAWGKDAHHGSAIRVAIEEGLVRPNQCLQVGIRGPYSHEGDLAFAVGCGVEIVSVDEIKWDLHSVVGQLRDMARKGVVYLSVDLSVLDPAYAPGVGIPCPGGLTTWELQQLLRALVGAELVGFDVVEVAPPYDVGGITSLAAVTVLQEILAVIADTRRSGRPASSKGTPTRRSSGRVSP